MSKKLATLFDDAVTSLDLEQSKFPEQNPLISISEILKEYDLNRLLKSLQKRKMLNLKLGFRANLLLDEASIEKLLSSVTPETIVAFDTETTGVDSKSAKIVGF